MRYPAAEKLEIIRLVEQSALPVRRTLEKIGIPRATFYRWYDLYQTGGPEALDDRHPKPDRVWNRIPDDVRERIVNLALDESALSPRELAVRFTDTEGYFVSEASVYRLLKAHDLIASPAFIVMKAADEFKDKTTAPNQLWQTDFTYLKVIGWGWFYLSTVLDDFSRYIIAWKLCTTMKAEDVTATLELALDASGLDKASVLHRPRLVLLDAVGRSRGRCTQEPRLELLTVRAVVDPVARRGNPLAGRNGCGVPNDRHDVPMAPRLSAQDAEAIFGIVIGHALNEARQNFLL